MTAVHPEVGIGGEEQCVAVRLGHADEARVGKAHWNVPVLVHQIEHPCELRRQFEASRQRVSPKERSESGRAIRADEIKCFREDRLARGPGRRRSNRLPGRPAVVAVAAAQERDEEPASTRTLAAIARRLQIVLPPGAQVRRQAAHRPDLSGQGSNPARRAASQSCLSKVASLTAVPRDS